MQARASETRNEERPAHHVRDGACARERIFEYDGRVDVTFSQSIHPEEAARPSCARGGNALMERGGLSKALVHTVHTAEGGNRLGRATVECPRGSRKGGLIGRTES